MPTATAALDERHQLIAPRLFLADPMPPSAFGPLGERDSLVSRIERIWNLRPSVIEISLGYEHPHDESVIAWDKKALPRDSAAQVLRNARREGLLIERSMTGYSITGNFNPAWRAR